MDGLPIPSRWRRRLQARWDTEPRLDTPARATAAGFWYLHEKEPGKAAEAFAVVRALPHGEEMYHLARALSVAHTADNLVAIAALADQPEFVAAQNELPPLDTRLHALAWHTLNHLQRAALETQTVRRSVSRAIRSQALNRALGELVALLDTVESIPEVERDLFKEIGTRWQDALLAVTAEIGQATILEPVTNPYVVGDPVVGQGFMGRDETLRRLEELWAGSQTPPSVVLFGHRRMGKTSILRNCPGRLGASVHLAYVNLQRLGGATGGAGDVLLALVDSVAEALRAAGRRAPEVDPAALQARPYRDFERYLRAVRQILGEDHLIIAVDEFEELETWMEGGQVPRDLLGVLRSYLQMDPHVAFAFAGLHTLEEMTADYFEPFFAGLVPVKVGFMRRGAVAQLLANPADDFPLDYEPEALERIWELTGGQPYLAQLVGHRLVSRFNDLAFEQGQQPEPRFAVVDVEAVIADPQFYQMGRYYFTGVWGQAGQGVPGQQAALRALAPHPHGLALESLAGSAGPEEKTLGAALQVLRQHDVVLQEGDRWRYAVELMRRWVMREKRAGDRD